jgi:hypothetical protein
VTRDRLLDEHVNLAGAGTGSRRKHGRLLDLGRSRHVPLEDRDHILKRVPPGGHPSDIMSV